VTMTVQERKRISMIKVMFAVFFFIYLGLIVIQLYLSKRSEYGSVTNSNYIKSYEDIQINSYKLYPGEPTTRELQLKDIQDRSSTFLNLNNEPVIP
jgi:cell division septal protein FtsQ